MSKIQELKSWLKEDGERIRQLKADYKEAQRGNGTYSRHPDVAGWNYRHHHIAYCELRGRTRDQIERPREGNEPNETKIQRIKEEYAWSPEEIAAYEARQAKRMAKEADSAA